LTFLIGVLTNVATGSLPEAWKPYLWLSWAPLGVCLIVVIGLQFVRARGELSDDGKHPSPAGGKTVTGAVTVGSMAPDSKAIGINIEAAYLSPPIDEQRTQEARQLEGERAQDAALQAYLDQMTQLLLHEDLRTSQPDDEVRSVARARTLTVLRVLDGVRKATVVQFLYEARLIGGIKREKQRPWVERLMQ